ECRQSAPIARIDRSVLACVLLVRSTDGCFGRRIGVLYGKRELRRRLEPYKVRANTNAIPQRWEWRTLNHECIAGITACVDYLAELGSRRLHVAPDAPVRGGRVGAPTPTRRDALQLAYRAIQAHERGLIERMLRGLQEIPGLRLYGINDLSRIDSRCPTFAVQIEGHTPLELATKLGEQGIFTWDGNYYAIN